MNFGPNARPLSASNGVGTDKTPLAIATTASKWFQKYSLEYGDSFALSLKLAGTTPDVKFYLEQSHYALTDAEEGLTHAKYVSPEGQTATILEITDTNWHHLAISPAALPWLRIKAIGQSGNGSDVTIEAWISVQEKFSR